MRGRPLNWARHYQRLRADCATLALAAPAETQLLFEISRVAPAAATVKIIVTRGSSGRGYSPSPRGPLWGSDPTAEGRGEGPAQTRIVAAFPPPDYPHELSKDGVHVRHCELVLSQQPRLAGAKTLNRLENVLARSEWSEPSIREGLLADASRRLVEGTMSNVFVVKDSRVATPDLSRCGVVGAQRERVRDLLRAESIECVVCDVPVADLEDADEIFLTNSLIGVWPVSRLGERRWTPGPVTRRVQSLLERDDAKDA